MSTFEHVALQQSAPYGLSDPLTVGLARRLKEIAGLGREPLVARFAACCGFGGAVIVQAGLLSLVARLVLALDTIFLPGVPASTYCLAFGALAMLASRPLADPEAEPAPRRTRLVRAHRAHGDRAA
jgi:hypothetical protein